MTLTTTNTKPSRNYCLGFFEAVACILIVFVHIKFPGDFGIAIEALARFGVPLFFMISGFFLIKEGSTVEEVRAKLKKRIIKILIIYLIAAAVQDLFSLIGAIQLGAVKEWFLEIFSWQNILYFIFCNRPFVCVAYWFLLALLNSYIFIYIFARHFIEKEWLLITILCSLVLFLLIQILAKNLDWRIGELYLSNTDLYRSWYARGVILMSAGMLIRRHVQSATRISLWVLLLVIFASIAFMITEAFIYQYVSNSGLRCYLSCYICAATLLVLSSKYPMAFSNFITSKLPEDWTTYVYVLHPGIIFAVEYALKAHMDPIAFGWSAPLIAVTLSVIVAILLAMIIKIIKAKKNK